MHKVVPLYTFLDIEASGINSPDSYPIEIAWFDTLCNHESFIILPALGWSHWDSHAELIHGISRGELYELGINVVEAAKRLNDSLGVETIFCDAPAFDGFWMKRLFDAAKIDMTFDLADVSELYAKMSNEQLASFLDYLGMHPAPHRALADAERYAKAFTNSYRG